MPDVNGFLDEIVSYMDPTDVVDEAILCMDFKELETMLEEAKDEIITPLEDEESVECDDLDEDESDCSAIGMDSEDYIDSANDIGYDDEDGDLIDIVSATEDDSETEE